MTSDPIADAFAATKTAGETTLFIMAAGTIIP